MTKCDLISFGWSISTIEGLSRGLNPTPGLPASLAVILNPWRWSAVQTLALALLLSFHCLPCLLQPSVASLASASLPGLCSIVSPFFKKLKFVSLSRSSTSCWPQRGPEVVSRIYEPSFGMSFLRWLGLVGFRWLLRARLLADYVLVSRPFPASWERPGMLEAQVGDFRFVRPSYLTLRRPRGICPIAERFLTHTFRASIGPLSMLVCTCFFYA